MNRSVSLTEAQKEALAAFQGTYTVSGAMGTAFKLLNANTSITISAPIEPEKQWVTVDVNGANADQGAIMATIDDRYNLTLELPGDNEDIYRVIIAGWTDADSEDEKLIFGQAYFGDPDGAGGFGGENGP